MRLYDFGLLQFCRDPRCEREEVHEAHGRQRRAVVASKPARVEAYCYTCGFTFDDAGVVNVCGYCGAGTTPRAQPHVFITVPGPQPPEVNDAIIEVTFGHVGTHVPTPFAELWQAVVDDFGSVSDRSVQRALRVLIDSRRVASIADSTLSYTAQRNLRIRPPGWYVRYDSPKLWRPGGLRDLMSVAAERAAEGVDLRPGVRRAARVMECCA